MRIFIYSFQTAVKNLWRESWINLLTVLSISVGLLILGAFSMVTLNLDHLLDRWARGFGLVVYLNEGLTKEEVASLREIFARDHDISEVTYISKQQALSELRDILGEKSTILAELKENPLPSSFILKLRRDSIDPLFVEEKAKQISRMPGIEEVQYGEKWLASLNTIAKGMKIVAIFLGAIIFVAVAFITYSTIKILFYRRIVEIETLKLLGATRSFIRLPFLIEGLFIGIAGGALSALVLFGMQSLAVPRLSQFLPSLKAIVVPLPPEAYVVVPIAGAVMSFTGSLFAVGKIRY